MEDTLPRLERLQSIMTLLQSGRLITSTLLSEKFQVSKRTIYRDIKSLEKSGTPIITIEGKGYQLMEGYTLPPVTFSEEEALALVTAYKLISTNKDKSLKKNHESAIEKIKAILRSTSKKHTAIVEDRIVSLHNLNRSTTSNTLVDIQHSIIDSKLLEIVYHSFSKEEQTTRIIEPMALYHTRDNWILIAWCRMRTAFREFRLDKILNMKRLEAGFPARSFDLLSYFLAQKNSQ